MNLGASFFLFVFGASCGVLQIVAAYNGMTGLSFFKRPILGYAFGFVAIIGMYCFFFLSGDRNVLIPRLEGSQLLGWSVLALFSSVVFTLVISSLVRKKDSEAVEDSEQGEGLEALKRETYLRLIKRLFNRTKGEV